MEIEIILALLILFSLVFLATIDLAFGLLSDVNLRRLAAESEENQNARAADFLRVILENRARFRFTISSAIQILNIVFTVLATLLVLHFTQNLTQIALFSLLISLIFSLIFRQVFPRLLISNNPEGKLLLMLPVVRPLFAVSSVLINPFLPAVKSREQQKLENTFAPDAAEEKTDDHADNFQALMEIGEAEGIIEENERELIETMFEFSGIRAEDIMTPRTAICALPVESTVAAARDLIIEEKFSRLPVYSDSIDDIVGVIYVRDLLQMWVEGKENQSIAPLLRPVFFVPETKTAAEMLKTMQSDHVQIAIVVDEYGGVAGLVTVEDILEEIVGEIEDEDTADEEVVEIIEGADGYFDVLGSTDVVKIERIFDLEFTDEDYTTIAGLVTSTLGYIPKVGEQLSLQGLDVEILKADEKRIYLLRLREADQNEPADGANIPADS